MGWLAPELYTIAANELILVDSLPPLRLDTPAIALMSLEWAPSFEDRLKTIIVKVRNQIIALQWGLSSFTKLGIVSVIHLPTDNPPSPTSNCNLEADRLFPSYAFAWL